MSACPSPAAAPVPRPGAPHRLALAAAAALAGLLSACGGGSDANPPAAVVPPPAQTLSGSVAVGAPMTDGRLRVLDATGAVVASDVVVAADGSYPAVTLTGTGPWRLEACGYTGATYQCIQSVALAAGTAHVTPLTTALMLLASGQSPDSLMSGGAPALTATALAAAQDTLRTGLAPALADAGVGAALDLVAGALAAGSRTGYDRLLDAVAVRTGVDGQPFVQIEPRLGSGNLFLQPGSASVGALATDSAAARLPLDGLELLFRNMSNAIRTAASCTDASTGLAASMAADASFTGDGEPINGAAAVAGALCGMLAGGGGEPSRLGSRFVSPTLGRCDFSGAAPVCGIGFALQGSDGSIENVGQGMGVTYVGGAWRFMGDLLPIGIHANATVQRDRRVDGDAVVDTYSRALAFEVPAVNGLACARVAQRDAAGAAVTLAYYKRHADGGPRRLSVWRSSADGGSRSLDPATGSTRTADDTWLMLPQGDAGDTAVRNFFRGGRSVTVSLYGDAACSTPFSVAGRSSFEVEVEGVPPVWASMPGLPWPSLDAASTAALRSLALDASAGTIVSAGWTVASGRLGVGEIVFCSDRARCGDGDTGRLGEAGVRGGATSGQVVVRNGATPVAAGGYKLLALFGRTADGAGLQSNHMSCPAVAAGLACEN